MPMDGLMTGLIASELHQCLQGGRIDKITQPEKDTVILLVRAGNENRNLLLCASPNNARAHLTHIKYSNPLEPPVFCMMLRKQLLGGRVMRVFQVDGDRLLHVEIDTVNELGDHVTRVLILEIMGRHSNLIFTDDQGKILEACRHVSADMNRVRQIQPGLTYQAPPGQDKLLPDRVTAEALLERLERTRELPLEKALGQSVMGLSSVTSAEIAYRVLNRSDEKTADLREIAERTCALLHKLPDMVAPCVARNAQGECTDCLPFPYLSLDVSRQTPMKTISEAMEVYFGSRDSQDRLNQKSASMVRILKGHVERCEKKLALQEEELASAARMEEYRIMGDVINANLWQLHKGQPEAVLSNFYDPDGAMIRIPLDIRLTPAQNAQRYFKKYQKARNARKTAAEQKEKTLAELDYLEGALLDIDKCVGESELEEIRQEMARAGYVKRATSRKQMRDLPQSKPYHYRSSDGIDIYVGKNAVQNERLTQSAQPGETWMHAKNMPGSHVIIRREGTIPQTTLLEAARLAAWYSKGRRSSGVPIDYTLKKHVKKPGGSPTGFVIYTDQRTLSMTVEEAEIRAIELVEE